MIAAKRSWRYLLLSLCGFSLDCIAQNIAEDESTVTYSSTFFAQFGPVSVNDMLDRIPGIDLALEGNPVPTVGGAADRGLGGSDQILINGKRLAGKANDASSQLERISANQVDYIEIIRGTSGNLDVRNSGQLVNIVLIETQSELRLATELGVTRFHDSTVKPIGSISLSGQSANFDYLVSADVKSGYEYLQSFETSLLPDLSINETRSFDRYRDQSLLTLNSNVVYQPTPADRFALNALFGESDPPVKLLRTITDYQVTPPAVSTERESIPATDDNWEFGGDYEHIFSSGGRYRVLFIVNEKNTAITRERFVSSSPSDAEIKNLFLDTSSRYQEKIIRTSYNWDIAEDQNLEIGVEHAVTTQDSSLKLGMNLGGETSPEYGDLTPVVVPNAISTVEEKRYEGFVVHNWQLSPDMSLESSLLYEVSEITQSGDVNKSRKFNFLKPKLDFRYNFSRSFQLRMSIEKDISQLSFADFSASTNDRDEDQDTVAGNPDLEQEQVWRYNLSLDYRLPNDGGVLNSQLFYYDIGQSIGKIDISPNPDMLMSTNGNVGDGKVYGMNLNASLRLGLLALPQAVLTTGILLQESTIYDPLIAMDRKVVPFDRGNFRIGFRHDLPNQNFNYGFNYRDGIDGNRPIFDIDNVIYIGSNSNLSLFAEKISQTGIVYRVEVDNTLNHESCRERRRYDGYLRDDELREIERYCTNSGVRFSFKLRATF